jgi:AAA+ ATPase superfamily predicted ATPase
MEMRLRRSEAKEVSRAKGWVLVFGRRKTGKTYLLRNFTKWDRYFLVRKDGSVSSEEGGRRKTVAALELARAVGEELSFGRTVIVDEFQRLPSAFLDDIAAYHPQGKLVLTGSSFRVMNDVFGQNSPVLGLLAEERIGLVRPGDVLSSLSGHLPPEVAVEFGTFVRDPWILPHLELKDSCRELFWTATRFQNAITGLVGEVFQEEERSLTILYEAILRLLGAGYRRSDEVASILSSRGILKNGNTSAVVPMINNMERMDLAVEMPVYGSKRKRAYLLKSPILELFYYLADRYDIENREVRFKEAEGAVLKVRNLAIQRFVGEIFAQKYEGILECSYDPELDFIITRKGRPLAVGEVKWGKYGKKELAAFAGKVSGFDCPKYFVARKKAEKIRGVELVDAAGLLKMTYSTP